MEKQVCLALFETLCLLTDYFSPQMRSADEGSTVFSEVWAFPFLVLLIFIGNLNYL